MSVDLERGQLEEWAARAETCRRGLRAFVREMWPVIERRPFVDNWHIGAVCEQLEAVSAGEIRRLIINQPPRSTKSTITAVMWPAWEWLTSPELQWLFASYSDALATKHSLVCRRLIQSEGLRSAADGIPWARRVGYRGMLGLLGQEWDLAVDEVLKTRFSNTETGYRIATSTGGTATGEGGDRLVIDDPLKASDARSDAIRKGANEWFDETWSTRLNDPVRAAHVVIMQRLHEQDLTGHLLGRGEWEHLCLPAEYEPKHPFVWPDDPRTVEGESLDPVRLPPQRLEELKRDLGSYGFAGQLQQRPSPEEGGMFKRDWWQRWTVASLPPRWERVIASWDLAFKDSGASSYVVGQVWGINGADRYLLGQVRARLEFTKTCDAIVALAAWRPDARAKLVEDKANGPAVMSALKRRVSGLIPVEPDGSKEARAAAVSPLVESGNVFLPAADVIPCPAGYEPTRVADFIEELANFPASSRNDQVDATSQALNWIEGRGSANTSTRCYRCGQKGGHGGGACGTPELTVIRGGGLTLVGEHHLDVENGRRVAPPGFAVINDRRAR
jgi:predicted phage terminase large subunit-like protein